MSLLDAVVVGAGPSGLAALRRFREANLKVIALEKRHDVGGVWLYEETPNGHSAAYRTLVTITSKACSGMEDFPFPKEWPDYLPHTLVKEYLRRYAEHFGLLSLIRFHTEVKETKRVSDRWVIHTASGDTLEARYLIAASGHHWKPYIPSYPGKFEGEIFHSHAYRDPIQLINKRILIVGGGNSAADIAADAVRVAKSVELSLRRGYYILPKFGFLGYPTDLLYKKLIAPLPRPLQRPLAELSLWLLQGPMHRYGMPKPREPLFYTHPLVNSELLYHLRHGKVRIRNDIQHLEDKRVYFTDGSYGEYDTLIWATGYEIDFPYLPPHLVPKTNTPQRLYLHIFSLDEPSLIFLGLIQPNGCLWNLSEKQAALAARYITGTYKLPSDAPQVNQEYWRKHQKRYHSSPRHLWEVDWHEYYRKLDKLVKRYPLSPTPTRA
ncbi:MAG: NAD(P)-binding domain-containing protein [Bacteroidia bacterium]|nr:NAD(P)-binding domain-containing protein [Bacteroidia bacterium]MDW8134388.1 NAD(P)-binding domain-containing protein [Bacteroidia bacterium]